MQLPLFFIAFSAIIFHATDSFEIEISPQVSRTYEQKGSQLTLGCGVVNNGEEEREAITWLKNGSPTPFERLEDDDTAELHLNSLRESDSANYTCKVKDQTKTIEVVVYETPQLEKGLSEQHLLLRQEGSIKCAVKSSLETSLRWEKKGVRILRGGNYVFKNDSLYIANVTKENGGQYICKAKISLVGKIWDFPIEVDVRDPPHVYSWKGTARATEGSSASIICAAYGAPKPLFKFYKDNSKTPVKSSQSVIVNPEEGKLYWHAVTLADAGNYTCEAINLLGNDSKLNRLIVQVAPKITEFGGKVFTIGEALRIRCKAVGFPTPKLTISKTDSSGKRTVVKESEQNDGDSRSVVEYEKTHENIDVIRDAGTYDCYANNSLGNALNTSVVDFLYAPFFNETPKQDEYLLSNHSNNISCQVFSNPPSRIVWTRNNARVESTVGGVYEVFEESQGRDLKSTLQITPTKDESGTYACKVTNEFSEIHATINVKEAAAPSVLHSLTLMEKYSTYVLLGVKDGWNGGDEIIKYAVDHNITDKVEPNRVLSDKLPSDVKDFDAVLKVDNLSPKTTYKVEVSGINRVGTGAPLVIHVETEAMKIPQQVVVEKGKDPCYQPSNVVIKWKEPDSSGAEVEKYRIQYRELDTTSPKQWITKESKAPNYKLDRLQQSSKYELKVAALNAMGWSKDSENYVFYVCRDISPVHSPASQNPQQASDVQGNNTGWLLGIVFVVTVVVCILVDLACYAANGCGVTKLICTKIRGNGKADKKKYGEKEEHEEREFLNMEDKQVTNNKNPTEV